MVRNYYSVDYNWEFNMQDGTFKRWGKTLDEDPLLSPVGPEILDLEIGTICNGLDGIPCDHCYKENNKNGKIMTFDTFKKICDKLPSNVTQIAFGIGDIDSNPDIWKIFSYCRDHGLIPNITINGSRMTEEIYYNLVKYCGTVSVSRYPNSDICYNAVGELIKRGMKQVNIHQLVCSETVTECIKLLFDLRNDKRLQGLYSVVLLKLKRKGRGSGYTHLPDNDYKSIIKSFLYNCKTNVGFDTCFGPLVEECINEMGDGGLLSNYLEKCESGLFSAYINVDGIYYPCSFAEGCDNFKGINVLKVDDFLLDIWYNREVLKWRTILLEKNRNCPLSF